MVELALGALGAGIGSLFGMTSLGLSIGLTIGGMLSTGPNTTEGRLTDLRISGSSYGADVPYFFGSVRLPGNIIYTTLLQEHDSGSGGDSGGGQPSVASYYATFAVLIALAKPGAVLNTIFADTDILYQSATGPADTYCDSDVNVAFDAGVSYAEFELMSSSAQAALRSQCNARHSTQPPRISTDAFTFYDGTQTTPDASLVACVSPHPSYSGYMYVVFKNIDLSNYGNKIPNLSFEVTGPDETLESVVVDLCSRAGISTLYMDTSAGASIPVHGYAPPSDTIENQLAPLLAYYLFDLVEVDGLLRLVKRGGDPVATWTLGDLGAQSNDDEGGQLTPTPRLTRQRGLVTDLPASLTVNYFNPAKYHEQGSQQAIRNSAGISHVQTTPLNLSLTLTDAEARNGAEQQLANTWIERNSYAAATSDAWLAIAPGDVVILPTGERARVVQQDLGWDAEIQHSLVQDGNTAITLTAPAGDTGTPATGLATIIPTLFDAWAGPELTSADGAHAGFYVAATGGAGWTGCTVWYGVPDGGDGTTWLQGTTITSRSVLGTAVGALGDGSSTTTWDTTHTVDVVTLMDGLLNSTTETAVLNHDNVAKLGAEYLGFATATLGSTANRYTLSDLRRGGVGTSMVGHVAGDDFVALTTAVSRILVDSSLIGQAIQVKCLSAYQVLSDVTAQDVVIIAPTAPYATAGDVATAISGGLATVPVTPFWRLRGYIAKVATPPDGPIDDTYFEDGSGTPGANYPRGYGGPPVQHSWTQYASGPGGGFRYVTPGLGLWLWARISIVNSTPSNVTFNHWLPGWDDAYLLRVNDLVITTNLSLGADQAGTITVPASTTSLIELFWYNKPAGYVAPGFGSDAGVVELIIDAFEQTGLTFADAGV
jgi:hypothetical protein